MPKYVDAYCDIAGMSKPDEAPDKPCFYAHDGATCTVLRVYGTLSLKSEDEAGGAMVEAFQEIASSLREKGHALTITLEQSENISEDVERLVAPLNAASARKGLSMDVLTDETKKLLEQQLLAERILIAVWTYREAAAPERLREDVADRRDAFGRLGLPSAVQNPAGPYVSLMAEHFAFVGAVETALDKHGFMSRRLGARERGREDQQVTYREDLAEVRRALLFHETPSNWSPAGPGDIRYPRAKAKKSSDISTLFAPTLDSQIMTSAVKSSSDLRTIEIGGRKYGSVYLSLFPRFMPPFRSLLENIRGTGTRQRTMPFRIAMHIEGGARINGFRKVFATFLSAGSAAFKNLKIGFDGVKEMMARDEETCVNARILATTWIEPGEDDRLLNERRSRLTRALNSWQSPIVSEATSDPLRLLAETAAGMVATPTTGAPTIAAVRELGLSLPFHTDAPVEAAGETIFVSMDGKALPFRAHSPLQSSWLTLFIAPMGSGKSVLLNSMNLDFAAYYSGANLPFIGSLDVGESSRGYINQLQSNLPPELRGLVKYVRMKNEADAREYRVNPWDIGLGRRMPLRHEQSFIENVLTAMIGLTDNMLLPALVENIVTTLFQRMSDMSVTANQKPWQLNKDAQIDAAARRHGIELHDDLTWWQLTDAFAKRGDFVHAERAQRFAVPNLTDVVRYLGDPELRKRFGEDLCRTAGAQIESAIHQFPVFSSETQLDIGEARIVSIDLQDVIHTSPTSDADKRNNVLFFLMTREMFVKKISGHIDDVKHMRFPADPEMRGIYQTYWRKRYTNIQQTRKRFCFDEFHVTGASPVMKTQIDQDIRVGRKWGYEIYLASQKISDFTDYIDLASNIFILKTETDKDRAELKSVIGGSVTDSVISAMRQYVHGPNKTDITIPPVYLLIRKTSSGESCLLAKYRMGPVRLWALSTNMEDRALRDAVIAMTGDVNTALSLLSTRFPNGSAYDYWKQIENSVDPSTDIASMIAERLLAERMGVAAQ